jgi:hypothetical protein
MIGNSTFINDPSIKGSKGWKDLVVDMQNNPKPPVLGNKRQRTDTAA